MFGIEETNIKGVFKVKRHPKGDYRGWLERLFCEKELKPAGWTKSPTQINRTFTKDKGTVRGMHYQTPPHAEMKLVSCLHGSVLDVAVDIRAGSPTFLKHLSVKLNAEDHNALLIPEGVAHGFQTLSDDVYMLYFHSASYAPDHEDSIHPQDPAIQIDWPLEIQNLSERDSKKEFLSHDFKGMKL